MKYFICLVGFFIVPTFLFGLTLEEAIEKATINYPGYEIRKRDTFIGKFNLKGSYASFYPIVTASAVGAKTYDDDNVEMDSGNVNLGLNYNIFSGFRDKNTILINKLSLQLLTFIYEDFRKYIINEVSNIYFEIFQYSKMLESYKILVNNSGKLREMSRVRYDIGKIKRVEYLEAEADYSRREYEYSTYEQMMKTKLIELSTYTGEDYTIDESMNTDFIDVKVKDISYYLEQGYNNNVDIYTKEMESQKLFKEVKGSYANFYPSIDLYANENRSYRETSGDKYYGATETGIRATWELFSGFRDYFNVKSKKEEYYKKIMEKKLAEYELKERIYSHYNNILSYDKQFDFLENLMRFSKENYLLTEESYDLGKSTMLELIDARDRYEDALINYFQTRYNIIFAFNEMKYLAGIE